MKGFTLIELLVVVLIIGILSSVALPQYTKAVEKSRASEAITLLGSIEKAEQLYYMGTGSYTANLSELDLQFSNVTVASVGSQMDTTNFTIYAVPVFAGSDRGVSVSAVRSTPSYSLQLELLRGEVWRVCTEYDNIGICKSVTGGLKCSEETNGAWCEKVPGGPV